MVFDIIKLEELNKHLNYNIKGAYKLHSETETFVNIVRNNYNEIKEKIGDSWDLHQFKAAFGRLTESNFDSRNASILSSLKRTSQKHLDVFNNTQSRLRSLREEVVTILKRYY